MTYIILVGGIKGGVGKSLVSKTCIEYLKSTGKSVLAVDSDQEVGDVLGHYGSESIGFSDDLRRAMEPDRILEMAEENPDYIVVNLPGNTYKPLQEWLITTGSIKTRKAPEGQPQFIQFFVTDGCWSSIQLFKTSLEEHNDNLPHVLIRNEGRLMSSPDWSYLDKVSEYTELFEEHCILTADFPLVATPVLFELDQKGLTFEQAINNGHSLLARRAKFFVDEYNRVYTKVFQNLPKLVTGNLKSEKPKTDFSIDDLAALLKKDPDTIRQLLSESSDLNTFKAKFKSPKSSWDKFDESNFQKLRDKLPATTATK